jgi:hypothetical protein
MLSLRAVAFCRGGDYSPVHAGHSPVGRISRAIQRRLGRRELCRLPASANAMPVRRGVPERRPDPTYERWSLHRRGVLLQQIDELAHIVHLREIFRHRGACRARSADARRCSWRTWSRPLGCLDNPGDSVRVGDVDRFAGLDLLTFTLERLYIQRASVGWQFSGRATLEEAACRELLLQNDLFLKH